MSDFFKVVSKSLKMFLKLIWPFNSLRMIETQPAGGNECVRAVRAGPRRNGGADGIRTHDLLDAIEARSQLRHGPTGEILFNASIVSCFSSTRAALSHPGVQLRVVSISLSFFAKNRIRMENCHSTFSGNLK
jgi:hypothetical protein